MSDVTVASLLLREHRLPVFGNLFAAHAQWWPREAQPQNVDYSDGAGRFRTEEAVGFLCFGDFPMPDLATAVAHNDGGRLPEMAELIRSHSAHVMVGLAADGLGPLKRAVILTRWVASVAEACGALAVNWGSAEVVVPKEEFNLLAREMNDEFIPILLWVRFAVDRESDGGWSLATEGMRDLGHWEIETNHAGIEKADLLNYATSFAVHLITEDVRIADGDTFGFSKSDRIGVRHANAADGSGPVYRLEFGQRTA